MMSMTFKLTIAGKPFGKQRPKATIRGKHAGVYTPKETIEYENLVVAMFRQTYPYAKPIEGEVRATIVAFYPIPSSASKKKKQAMKEHQIKPMVKPDIDNVCKIICDALNGVAYTDDSHITAVSIAKYYSETPRVEVKIEEVANDYE